MIFRVQNCSFIKTKLNSSPNLGLNVVQWVLLGLLNLLTLERKFGNMFTRPDIVNCGDMVGLCNPIRRRCTSSIGAQCRFLLAILNFCPLYIPFSYSIVVYIFCVISTLFSGWLSKKFPSGLHRTLYLDYQISSFYSLT